MTTHGSLRNIPLREICPWPACCGGDFFPEIIREIADDFYKRRICSMTFGWFDVVEIPEDQRWLISNLVYQMFNGLLPEMHDGCLLTGTLLPHARSCECVKYACATHQDYLCALKLGQQEASPYFRKDDAEANIINESGPLCWVFEKGQFTARGRGAIIQLRCPHQPHMGTQPSHFQPVAARTSSRSRSPPARPSGARPPDKCGIGPIIELTKLLQDHEEYVHTYLKKHKTDLQTLEADWGSNDSDIYNPAWLRSTAYAETLSRVSAALHFSERECLKHLQEEEQLAKIYDAHLRKLQLA